MCQLYLNWIIFKLECCVNLGVTIKIIAPDLQNPLGDPGQNRRISEIPQTFVNVTTGVNERRFQNKKQYLSIITIENQKNIIYKKQTLASTNSSSLVHVTSLPNQPKTFGKCWNGKAQTLVEIKTKTCLYICKI